MYFDDKLKALEQTLYVGNKSKYSIILTHKTLALSNISKQYLNISRL